MAISYKKAFQLAALGAGNTTAYTVPVGVTAHIRAIAFHNATAANVVGNVHFVLSGGSAAANNRILSKTIMVGKTDACPECLNHILDAGDSVVFSGTGLNATLSVVEVAV